MINSIRALQKAAEYLINAGLDDIKGMDISVHGNTITLSVYPFNITESENRRLKNHFGPLRVKGTGDYKQLVGRSLIGFLDYGDDTDESNVTIKYTINSAFTCRRIPKEELEGYDYEELHAMAMRGDIELPECKPQPFKAEPTEDTAAEPTDVGVF